jgi:hypothetical protein
LFPPAKVAVIVTGAPAAAVVEEADIVEQAWVAIYAEAGIAWTRDESTTAKAPAEIQSLRMSYSFLVHWLARPPYQARAGSSTT